MRQHLLLPDPDDPRLTEPVVGIDQEGRSVEAAIVHERPLTLFLNGQEIVTMMTIGDHPDYLAVGYLLNQNMLRADDVITAVEHDEELELVVVRTERQTDFETKLQKKVRTSGCAQGTAFGDLMEKFDRVRLPENARIRTSWLYGLMRQINTLPSLYLKAGAIHGCALCEEDRILVYLEDVGRHNAVDKVIGHQLLLGRLPLDPAILLVSGRASFEVVQKAASAGVPIVCAVSAPSSLAIDLARRLDLTLVGFLRPGRMNVYHDRGRIELG